jgi:hypothetical protein
MKILAVLSLIIFQPILKKYYSDFIEPRRKYNLRLVQHNLVDFICNISPQATPPTQKRDTGVLSDNNDMRCLFPICFQGGKRIATGGSSRMIARLRTI